MFSTRDQENLIHGHQTAGAAKSTNLSRQLPPKTPGAKVPKTPFKVPLNDENDGGAFGAGKSVLNTVGKSNNENAQLGGKKGSTLNQDAFKTPMASRAPLGQKTTNAKAKGQLGGNLMLVPENDLAKSRQRSASARKRGPRISHAEPVKIDVLSDGVEGDEIPDIGVTHPRPKDLDDFEGEVPEIDLSVMQAGLIRSGVYRDMMEHDPVLDGMSMNELRRRQDAEDRRVRSAITEATCRRDVELSQPAPCLHEPDCGGWECKDEPARRRRVEAECDEEVTAIRASWKIIDRFKYHNEAKARREKAAAAPKAKPTGPRVPKSTFIPLKPTAAAPKPAPSTTGPSSTLARSAASKLATQPPRPAAPTTALAPTKSRYPAALSRKPSNPAAPSAHANAARHASARAVSNTTLGYAKGRAASAQMRGSVLPRSDRDVFAPPRPESNAAAIDDLAPVEDEQTRALDQALLEDALQEFELPMPEE